jgi:hypothetical protein
VEQKIAAKVNQQTDAFNRKAPVEEKVTLLREINELQDRIKQEARN